MLAVTLSGNALEFIDKKLRSDKSIAQVAVARSGRSYEYIDKTLKADKEIATLALADWGWDIYQNAAKELKIDKDTVLLALTKDPDNLKYVDKELRKEADIIDWLKLVS